MEISVITTTYNGLPFLVEAIQSILAQTFVDFEYVIVDDGSTDTTAQVVTDIADPRIRYLKCTRIGRPAALNIAMQQARGRYLANLDADDYALAERLANQKTFLDNHPEVGMVGSAYYLQHPDTTQEMVAFPFTDAELRQRLFTSYPFAHSAVMYRRQTLLLAGGFDESLSCSIDYDACVRLAQHAQLANMPIPLIVRRIHERNYFIRRISTRQYVSALSRIKWRYWQNAGYPLPVLPKLLASILLSGMHKWMQDRPPN